MKKIISLILAIFMIATFVPLTVNAIAATGDYVCFIDTDGSGRCNNGEVKYTSIMDALAAPHGNESEDNPTNIALLCDVSATFCVDDGRYIYINTKGRGLTSTLEAFGEFKPIIMTNNPTYFFDFGYGEFCIANNGNLTIEGGNIRECTLDGSAIYNGTKGVLKVHDCDLHCNKTTSSGGAINNCGKAEFTDCSFLLNEAEVDGGVISNSGDVTFVNCNFESNEATKNGGVASNSKNIMFKNCTLTNNTAGDNGGAIHSSDGTKCVVLNTTIKNNRATNNGGGIYYGSVANCVVAGTKITMADGTTKNVEDVVEGDIVKTFDHEAGTFSSAKVYFAYADDEEASTFKLTFDNEDTMECVTSYSFLEQSSRKYVELTNENATSYIGKCFYGEDGKWHKLENVTFGTTNNEYDIYTSNCQNVITNGMLSSPADVSCLINIYNLDENLKADEAQLAADIKRYGLVSYEYASALCDMNKEWYSDCSVKYVFIAIGKGLTTWEKCFGTYASVGKLTTIDKFDNNVVTIGAGTKIYSNNGNKNNVYLEKNYYIAIHGDITDTATKVGVTLAGTTGKFTTNGTFEDVKYFVSDNKDYSALYNKDGYLEIDTHTTCSFGEWETTEGATCETSGTKTRTCSVCGKEETETIAALGHIIYYPVKNDTLPTCTEDGHNNIYEACTRCDYYKLYEVETLPKTGHNLTDWTVVTKATCTTDGLKRRTCTKCNYNEEEVIKATGHSDVIAEFNRVNPTCSTVGGYDNYYVCATCHRNEFIEHITIEKIDCTAGEWEIVKEATEDEEGLRVKKCTECGEIVVSETIEKLPKTEPETKEETITETTTEHHHDDTDYSDICLICGNDHHGNLIQDFICLIVSVCRKIAAFFNGGTWGPGARFPLPVE